MNARLLFCSVSLTGLLIASTARGQVTIPARSASSLDNGTTTVTTPPVAPVVPLTNSPLEKSNVSRVTVPAATPGGGEVRMSTTPIADAPVDANVLAVQRSEPTTPPVDVANIKRLAELAAQLRVAESAARARINLPADELFVSGEGVMIDPLAESALKSVVEYLERTLKKEVTVKVLYEPGDEEARVQGWARALVLIDWLEANSSLDPDRIRASTPVPLEKPAPKPNATSIGETEFISRIEIHLE